MRATLLVGLALLLVSTQSGNRVDAATTRETFESAVVASWSVQADLSGSGTVQQSTAQAAAGLASARVATTASGSRAQVRVSFTDAAGAHSWQERPGTWYWQETSAFVPASTVAQLGPGEYLTLGGLWASGQSSVGWWLRVRQGGALSVVGTRDYDGVRSEFPVYGVVPQDRWFHLELGLHSQAGPGVKRGFAFLVDGNFYGWYHQGRMQTETYDRAAVGVLETNSNDALEVFVDQWSDPSTGASPTGLDNRPSAPLQHQNYRTQSGVQWQIDWTTWANDLRLDPVFGVYSQVDRLQAGRNLDRLPDISDGWAEIEIDWPRGTPPGQPNGYFGPMVGFRKEINREQNLEVIPIGRGSGNVDLVFEAWDGSGPVILGQWPMPRNATGTTSIPQPGDIIRARWQQSAPTQLMVSASFFDASAGVWYDDVISGSYTLSNINGINYFDGYHKASSITIDSPFYSIRRYTVGTLDTVPPGGCTPTLTPSTQSFGAGGGSATTTVTAATGCSWSATSNDGWITVTSGATGTGSGTVGYAVAPNPGAGSRTGTVSIGGQTLTISQAAAPVAPAITTQPADQTVTAGGTTSFTVAASGTPAPTYQWQVSTNGGPFMNLLRPFTSLTDTPPYSGASTGTLTITGATVGLAYNQYRALATNGVAPAATSAPAMLTVTTAPTIATPSTP